MLAYEAFVDSVDDYLRFGETTTLKYVDKFIRGVIYVFGSKYLRRSNIKALYVYYKWDRHYGFLGMLGSVGCNENVKLVPFL